MNNPKKIIITTALFILTVGYVSSIMASEPNIYSPPKGSSERKAIMDALRVRYNQKVVFIVHYLKISGDWAWTRVTATIDGKPSYEPEATLVYKGSGEWKVVDAVDQSGECAIEPKCIESEYKKLKSKFPAAPSGIFER